MHWILHLIVLACFRERERFLFLSCFPFYETSMVAWMDSYVVDCFPKPNFVKLFLDFLHRSELYLTHLKRKFKAGKGKKVTVLSFMQETLASMNNDVRIYLCMHVLHQFKCILESEPNNQWKEHSRIDLVTVST